MEENRIQEQNNGEMTAVAQPAKKENIVVRVINGVKRGYLTIRSTRVGRVAITGTKAALVGLGLYKSYKFGEKHAKPQYIYVTEGVVEDAAPEEEDPVDEPTDEELEKMVEEELAEE